LIIDISEKAHIISAGCPKGIRLFAAFYRFCARKLIVHTLSFHTAGIFTAKTAVI